MRVSIPTLSLWMDATTESLEVVTITDTTEGMVILVVVSVERVTSESVSVDEVLGRVIGDGSTISGFVSVVIDGQLPTY
jgi:hypothetical protein